MTRFDVLWWFGLTWFAAWVAAPLLLLIPLWTGSPVGAVAIVVGWGVTAPWTALLGTAGVHRLLPHSPAGRFRMFSDRGSVLWALKAWAPPVWLALFQRLVFLSGGAQVAVLKAFGASIGARSRLTSQTVVSEPHRVRIGCDTLIGEFAHLACSMQARPGLLIVADIEIGDRVLIGAHAELGPGARIASDCILESAVRFGGYSSVGERSRIASDTTLYNAVRVGCDVRIGKGCLIPTGSIIPDGTKIPDGTVWRRAPQPSEPEESP